MLIAALKLPRARLLRVQPCKSRPVPVLLASGSLAKREMLERRMAAAQQVTAGMAHLFTMVQVPALTSVRMTLYALMVQASTGVKPVCSLIAPALLQRTLLQEGQWANP